MKLLKEDVLAKVLLKNYEESAPEFLAFVDGYASGRNDAALSGMIYSSMSFQGVIHGQRNGCLRRQKAMA